MRLRIPSLILSLCLLIAAPAVRSTGTAAPTESAPLALPPGLSVEQAIWLQRLGEAKTPERTARVLSERDDADALLKTMTEQPDPTDPALAKAWLPMNPGLLVLGEHATDPVLKARGILRAGIVLRRNSRYDEAQALYEKARGLFEAAGGARGAADCWYRLSGIFNARNDLARTERSLREAIRLYTEAGDVEGTWKAYDELGNDLVNRDRLEDALAVYREARSRLPQSGYESLQVDCDARLGRSLVRLGRYDEAKPLLDAAQSVYEARGDKRRLAFLLQESAELDKEQGRGDDAIAKYQKMRALALELGITQLATVGLANEAGIQMDRGHLEEARDGFERALAVFEQTGDRYNLAMTLGSLGTVNDRLGDFNRAVSYYERAVDLLQQPANTLVLAKAYRDLGRMYGIVGRLPEALAALDRARTIYESLHAPWASLADIYHMIGNVLTPVYPRLALAYLSKAQTLNETEGGLTDGQKRLSATGNPHINPNIYTLMGGVYLTLGEPERASAEYQKAWAIYDGTNDDAGRNDILFNLARLSASLGKMDEALAYLDRNEAVLQRSCPGDTWDTGSGRWFEHYMERGKVLLALHRFDTALECFVRACEFGRRANRIGMADNLFYQGMTQELRGQREDAFALYRQAMSLRNEPSVSASPELAGMYSAGDLPACLANLLVARHDTAGAFQIMQEAKGTAVRRFLLGPKATAPIPSEDAKRLKDLRAAFENAERRADASPDDEILRVARDQALAQFTSSELALRARYPRWGRSEASPATAGQIARKLDRGTAILEVLIKFDRMTLLVLRQNSGKPVLSGHIVPVNRRALEALVERTRAALENPRSDPRTLSQLLSRLYSYLIRPVEKDLPGIHTLVICPDRFLHAVPFAALKDGSGTYLIQRYAITLAPSGSAWEACRSVAASHKGKVHTTPVLAAVSRFSDASTLVATLAPTRAKRGDKVANLPGVLREAKVVKNAFHGRVVALLEKEATVEAVEKAASRASVLHLATHAFTNDTAPMLGSLLLSPSPKNPSGQLYARDVFDLPLSADLAVLSACSTNEGRATGEGLIGLAWAFLVAGCPSTIGSRGEVDDNAARLWMGVFYRNYTKGFGAAESRRQACLALLRTKGAKPDYSSPRHWAAWSLIGNDR